MPHYKDSRRARRKKLFARSLSTFITNKSKPNCSILGLGNMLHSKSTYSYRWGSRLNYVVPSVCGLALLVGGIITINPLINHNLAHAGMDSGDPSGSTGSSTDTPSISIAFPTTGLPAGYNNNAEQTTTVTPGVVAYRSNYFDVTVRNPSWYAVSVRAAKGYTSELKNGEATIAGVGENVTPNNFKENTWGYALTKVNSTDTVIDDASLAYSTLPNEDSITIDLPGYITDTAINDHYKVSFATLFSGDVPGGHYTTKVYLSAVTNPGHVASNFNNIGYMQAMTSEICSNAEIGTTTQLKDARDGKFYWITKLKDSNCWMTQNLDYDGGGDNSTLSSMPNGPGGTPSYYDPGDYYYNGKRQTAACTTGTGLSKCGYFVKVTQSTTDADLHYHIGNYYSWTAAVDGTNDNIINGEASGSICPSGWKLPTGGSDSERDFWKLMAAYGWSTSNNKSSVLNNNNGIYGDPLYFVYGGIIYDRNLNNAGHLGAYWTSMPQSTNAYYLNFSDTISPYGDNGSWYGASVRCVFIPE